jgi:hypothetical protein
MCPTRSRPFIWVNKVTGKAYLESHWLEDWTIPAVAAVMRAAWMSPILHIAVNNPFVHPSGIIVPGWWLLALLLVPVFLQRLSLPRPWLVAWLPFQVRGRLRSGRTQVRRSPGWLSRCAR